MVRILLINGPNLNKLGHRNHFHYGTITMAAVVEQLQIKYTDVCSIRYYQSNQEGDLIDCIQQYDDYDGIVINPGALGHYSYSLADALIDAPHPKVEVHISNIFAREQFRSQLVTVPACDGIISGLGVQGYALAIEWLLHRLNPLAPDEHSSLSPANS
jgi:3-dehydroquinate dehydratase-2